MAGLSLPGVTAVGPETRPSPPGYYAQRPPSTGTFANTGAGVLASEAGGASAKVLDCQDK